MKISENLVEGIIITVIAEFVRMFLSHIDYSLAEYFYSDIQRYLKDPESFVEKAYQTENLARFRILLQENCSVVFEYRRKENKIYISLISTDNWFASKLIQLRDLAIKDLEKKELSKLFICL